jgi:hypothetical protein
VSDERLHALLIRAADEGRAESQLQAWPVVQEAFREHVRAGAPRRRPRALAALATAALLALVAALAFTAPGSAVADWVRDHIVGKPGARKSAPALTHLPGGGRLLVGSRAGVWVVQADGSRRLLRGYAGATWSPRGLFIAAWRRHELFALEPAGAVRWSLARGGRVRAADWSPDGFRVAYLAGRSLRVVAGDGSGDRLLRRKVQAVAPAWKPRAPHFLAFAPRAGVLDVVETDLRALAWRRSIAEPARSLAWSADGGLLAVAGRSGVTVLDGNTGRVRDRVAALPGFRVQAISFAPRGARLAVVLNSPSGRARATSVDLGRRGADPRLLFAGGGRFSQVSWSPDGRWILIAWPAADQWLFLRSSKVTGVSAVRGIARQFDPGIEGPAFPALGPWCCAPTLE